MAATNFTVYRGKDIEAFKFGSVAWSEAEFDGTSNALDTVFETNNPGTATLIDLVGDRDANTPVEAEAWVKEIRESGGERQVDEEPLCGTDTNGAQNKEVEGSSVSKIDVEVTAVYRNNVPLRLFSDSTKCAILELDNSEGTTSGLVNVGYNNIIVTQVGALEVGPNGLMMQKIKFSCDKGLADTTIAVSQAAPSETWSKVRAGEYAEEVRLT